MRRLLSAYFSISKREFNGLLALVLLIVLIAAIPFAYHLVVPAENQGQLDKAIRASSAVATNKDPNRKYTGQRVAAHRKPARQLFEFDPNSIGIEEWQKLGLSVRQSAAIIKYRTKGGKFRTPEDLQKMYTISDEMYERLLPYVRISSNYLQRAQTLIKTYPTHNGYKDRALPTDKDRALPIIEVNNADSLALLEIKGIGPAFASRILKYRKRLGGFYKKEQLMEVFGLDSSRYQEIKNQISLDPDHLDKININTADIADFINHPYIRYKQVNALIQYRKQHGAYTSIADLSKVLILDAETISRLTPYLILSNDLDKDKTGHP